MLVRQVLGSMSCWLDVHRSLCGGWFADWQMGSQHCGRGELELVGLLRGMSWLLVVVLVSLLLARSRRFDDGMLGNNLAG